MLSRPTPLRVKPLCFLQCFSLRFGMDMMMPFGGRGCGTSTQFWDGWCSRRWFNKRTLDDAATTWFNIIFNPGNLWCFFCFFVVGIFFPISKVLHDCHIGVSQNQKLSFHTSINSWLIILQLSNLTRSVAGRFDRGGRFHHVWGRPWFHFTEVVALVVSEACLARCLDRWIRWWRPWPLGCGPFRRWVRLFRGWGELHM